MVETVTSQLGDGEAVPGPRLLILGSGFAAYRLLKGVDPDRYDVTMVSARNHFLYTPLLPSTTVSTVEFRTILEPIRRANPDTRFFMAMAESLDWENRRVTFYGTDQKGQFSLPYDLLAIAVGAEVNTYNIPGVHEHTIFLKELSDARRLRDRVIAVLERAALPDCSPEERKRLLHFVGVGAGPTGVRFAAELHDLLIYDLVRSYPDLIPDIQITLVEAGKTLLSAYDESLQKYTLQAFQRQRIAVRTDAPVAEVGPGFLRLKSGEVIEAGAILWATGFAPVPFVARLPFAKDKAGRLLTDEYLRLRDHPEIFALGDCAYPENQPLPQLAQVAEQQGKYLADALNRRAAGKPCGPFRWKNLGVSSYIGEDQAVLQSPDGRQKFVGFLAYQLWRSTLFTHLVSPRNKILVPLDRLRSRLFGRDLGKF